MNAGKSTTLLQSAYNYRERGMNPLLLIPQLDSQDEDGKVSSRIGIDADAMMFSDSDSLLDVLSTAQFGRRIHCVLVDEAQFLTRDQVDELTDIVDSLDIPVLAYGLRTDFQGNLFDGSRRLLAVADNLVEIKTICHCGSKATMVLRLDETGRPVRDGEQIRIGGNDQYISVCRRHFKQGATSRKSDELPFEDTM